MAYVLRDGTFPGQVQADGLSVQVGVHDQADHHGRDDPDCETEAMKIAQNMAVIKHDAVYGRTHTLKDPTVRKVGGTYVTFGHRRAPAAPRPQPRPAARRPELPRPPAPGASGSTPKARSSSARATGPRTVCEVIEGARVPRARHGGPLSSRAPPSAPPDCSRTRHAPAA